MKKIISVICAVVLLISSVSVSAFALTKEDAESELAERKEIYEKVISQQITASNARDVLLYSAGLNQDDANIDLYDIDSDGVITAIDARLFLRVAAQLENVNDYFLSAKYEYFRSIINSIKPGNYKYYQSVDKEMKKVSYTDPDNLVGEMNRQMNLYADYDPEMAGFDFGAEIKASEGDKDSIYSTARTQIITDDNYPIKSNELACFAELDAIEKIEFKSNQSFTFERYSSVSNYLQYQETVTGLDSATIYFKTENVSLAGNLNGIFDNLKISKAFDVLSEDEVEKLLEANSAISSIEGMEDLGTCDIRISPKNLEYGNCFITVYYYPETGIPVGTVHNLNYSMSMNLFMNIDISAGSLAGDSVALQALITLLTIQNWGKLLKLNGSMDIVNEMNENTKFYFHSNNPEHIPY